MEARKFWNVLIVDDEPDIHEISELSLKRETVFGAKLKLHHAKSAKEARDFFEYDEAAAALAVAFIDVVMETVRWSDFSATTSIASVSSGALVVASGVASTMV